MRLAQGMLGLTLAAALAATSAVALTVEPANAGAPVIEATAGNTVQGVVTFADGSPAAGALVSLRFDPGARDTADGSGAYSISDIDDGFAIVDAVINVGGTVYSGTQWVGFAPGGGSTVTANIVVRPALPSGPFPPLE